jgi:signal-transduction protein with cAMP-binding, CBS, and nucleotidyltransferase domain
MQTELI